MKKYDVLWIDDEPEKQDGVIDDAALEGITFYNFTTNKAGMDELKNDPGAYDAIVLDAKGYEESEDEFANLSGLLTSIKTIHALPVKKPYFIYSAHMDSGEYAGARDMLKNEEIFKKGTDNQRLFERIKEESNKQEDTIIKHQHERVFEVCTDKYLGTNAGKDLISLFKDINAGNSNSANFNLIRKIVEDVFLTLNKFQLIPSAFVTPQMFLTPTSKFLSGLEQHEKTDSRIKDYLLNVENHIPEQISNNLRNILTVTQSGSHRSGIDVHIQELNTTYLLQSTLYQLLDVIIWLKLFIDSDPIKNNWVSNATNPSNNRAERIEETEFIQGEVIEIHVRGFGFLKPLNGDSNIFIPPHLVNDFDLTNGMIIKGEPEEYLDNRTNETRQRIKNIALI